MLIARALLQGLTEPHPAVGLGALGVATAALAAVLWLLQPEVLIARPFEQLMRSPVDDPARITHQVLTLQRQPWPDRAVLLLGPSSTREAITSTGALAAELGPQPPVIHDLSGRGLTLLEDVAILDALPDGFRGVVAWTVSPTALAKVAPSRYPRLAARSGLQLGFTSDARDEALRAVELEPRRRTGIYALDVAPFLLQRVDVLWRTEAPTYRRHRSGGVGANLEANTRDLAMKLAGYDQGSGPALALIRDALRRWSARAASVRFLLIEQTTQTHTYRELLGTRRHRLYQRRIATLADARDDTTYRDLSSVLRDSDFGDLVHLSTEGGRQRFTEALGRSLAEILDPPPEAP